MDEFYANMGRPHAELPLEVARRLVDDALLARYADGETADQLFDRYTSFGDDPFVVALAGAPKVEFSAATYARQRVQDLRPPPAAAGNAGRACATGRLPWALIRRLSASEIREKPTTVRQLWSRP